MTQRKDSPSEGAVLVVTWIVWIFALAGVAAWLVFRGASIP